MARFSFCGPTYQSQSPNADAEYCLNWYVEQIESGEGKSRQVLYPSPGLLAFCTLAGTSVRGHFGINDRIFAVSGTIFYEIFSDGTFTNRGAVTNDNLMVSMASSAQQLLLASGGSVYVFDLAANTLTTIPPATFTGPVSLVGFSDGFFIALVANSARFYVSNTLDATDWTTNGSAIVSVFADNVVSMIVDHRELWLCGKKASVVYYNSGNTFPYDVVTGGFIEQGSIATFGMAKLDNSIFWLGGDPRGAAVAWRAQGYTPQRISNHAVEFKWQAYATITDAVAYSYQDQGHSFYVLYFPSANATWVYDVATQMWHERAFLDPMTGALVAHHSQCHVYAFGKHLVGDWASGKIYQMAINLYDDDGSPLTRIRRSPHVNNEAEWMFHSQLQVDMETGLGTATGQGSDPQISLRWSDDGGHSWSNQYLVSAGKMGQYKTRAIWRRLGRSRDRVYEISVSDPIPWRIIDSYLQATPGYVPTERLSNQLRKAG